MCKGFSPQRIENSSSSGEYGDSSDFEEEKSSSEPRRTKSQEFTIDLEPMFQTHSMKTDLSVLGGLCLLPLSKEEACFEKFNCPGNPPTPPHVEPIQCVIVNTAHLAQFPPAPIGSPTIVAWSDAETACTSEYQPTIEKFFKDGYGAIRQHLTFFFSIAPNMQRLNNMASIRRQVPAGRILFHYIGHGFPKITKDNIWCSERRSKDFMPFPLAQLFLRVQPPTWFVFDCSNAAVVIETFEKASFSQGLDSGFDPRDWFCICASGVDEELPVDPRLPRDFLTSCVMTPVKMAFICHILQHYRTTMAVGKFPLELPEPNIWWDSPDKRKLGATLSALTDAIASDGLEPGLYHKIFRMDRLSAVLFRHFLLAQFLLRPYRVHPVSYPAIPDLSLHPLWRKWSIILDSMICSVSVPKPLYPSQLYEMAESSFMTMLKSDKLEAVKPYHLTLLFHMLFSERTDRPLQLIAEYSGKPNCDPDVLATTCVFHPLFARMIQSIGKTAVFHPSCYLILKLLYHYPNFATEIRKELDVSKFPALLFDRSLALQTRILVAAILASVLVSNDMMHRVCSSSEYLVSLRKELENAETIKALWILLVVRRTFHMCSPDPSLFVSTALHLQCAMYVRHPSPSCRAAAVGALASLLRPFECNTNGQLLFMAIPVAMDVSYLVRFHFLLLLKRFVISFDDQDPHAGTGTKIPTDSHKAMMAAFFRCESFNQDQLFKHIDEVVNSDDFLSHAYAVALFLLTYYTSDPYPSISTLARQLVKFIQSTEKQSGRRMAEIDEDELSFNNVDQNEALYRIALRNLLQTQSWNAEEVVYVEEKPDEPVVVDSLPPPSFPGNIRLTIEENRREKFDPIVKVAFHKDSLGIALATASSLIYIDDQRKVSTVPCTDIDDVQVAEWGQQIYVCASTNGGAFHVWAVGNQVMDITFRASPGRFVFVIQPKPFTILTADHTSTLYQWNLREECLVNEWETGSQSQTTALATHPTIPDVYVAGQRNGAIRELDISNPQELCVRDAIAPQPRVCVKRISIARRTTPEVFAVYENSIAHFYRNTMFEYQPIAIQHETLLREFDMHQLYQVLLFCPERGNPFLTDLNGKVWHIFKGVQSPCCGCFHPILPVVALGTSSGDMILYHFSEGFQ